MFTAENVKVLFFQFLEEGRLEVCDSASSVFSHWMVGARMMLDAVLSSCTLSAEPVCR